MHNTAFIRIDTNHSIEDEGKGRTSAYGRMLRSWFSMSDVVGAIVVLICFALGLMTIANNKFAVWLGTTTQLVVVGFVLSIMSLPTFKQAQQLLLVLEARYWRSTLQNFDAILRNDKFTSQSSSYVKLALLFLFALPLGLSAAYKQYVGGVSTVSQSPNQDLWFAPSGPPGLFDANGQAIMLNATSAFYAGNVEVSHTNTQPDTSFGYNMHVINESTVAMLDFPVPTNMSLIQSSLHHGQAAILSATINATFARLNSTPESTERTDPNYWNSVTNRLGKDNTVSVAYGNGTWFEMWNNWIDMSFVFLSYFNASAGETFEEKAIAFNVYRGTARGIWRITSDSIVLQSASDFETDYSPETQHPEITSPTTCNWDNATDTSQKIIYCAWCHMTMAFQMVVPAYIVGANIPGQGTSPAPLSNWVVIVAAMGWATTATKITSFGWENPQFRYMFYTADNSIEILYPTLSRGWGLYATLATQPLLFIIMLVIRRLHLSTPVSDNFGLVALLAGIERDSLDCLKGASSTGKVAVPVTVRFLIDGDGKRVGLRNSTESSITYLLSDNWEASKILRTSSSEYGYGAEVYKLPSRVR